MTVGLGLGTSRFPFDAARDYFRWIEHCEEAGVNSIWQTDRLVTNESMLECMSAMAVIAGHTERIRFGMNVASIALRDPLLTARQCATIDFLSDGRLLPAFGLGSAFSRDYVATGTPTKRRGKKLTRRSNCWPGSGWKTALTLMASFFSTPAPVLRQNQRMQIYRCGLVALLKWR